MEIVMEKYVHRCVINSGPASGNKNWVEVDEYDYEYRNECPECGERLVTGRQLLAHTYGQLIADEE